MIKRHSDYGMCFLSDCVRLRRGQTWDSGLRGHPLHGRLAFVEMKRHLRIGLVVCRVLLESSIPVRSIIWLLAGTGVERCFTMLDTTSGLRKD